MSSNYKFYNYYFYIIIVQVLYNALTSNAQITETWQSLPISPSVINRGMAAAVDVTIDPAVDIPSNADYDAAFSQLSSLQQMQMYADRLPTPHDSHGVEGDRRRSPTTCRLPETLHGMYRTQGSSSPGQPIQYREVTLTERRSSEWGECVSSVDERYVFGMQKDNTQCYRCVSLIQRAAMLVQAVINDETLCYETQEMALQYGCPIKVIDEGMGDWLWSTSSTAYEQCVMSGSSAVSYRRGDGTQNCPGQDSSIDNCARPYQIDVNFRGCTFPEYNLSMYCIGSWGTSPRYIAMYSVDNDEYRCGVVENVDSALIVSLSNDSTCHSPNYETFTLQPSAKRKTPVARCSFARELVGDWSKMSVSQTTIKFNEMGDSLSNVGAITSTCQTTTQQNGELVYLVESMSHCGTLLGMNCVRVARRSPTVVQVQVSPSDGSSIESCRPSNTKWRTMHRAGGVGTPCSLVGDWRAVTTDGLCQNVSVPCTHSSVLSLVQFVCATNAIVDSARYECLASWTANGLSFDYLRHVTAGSLHCLTSRRGRETQFSMHGDECSSQMEGNVVALTSTKSCTTAPTVQSRPTQPQLNSLRPSTTNNTTSWRAHLPTGRHRPQENMEEYSINHDPSGCSCCRWSLLWVITVITVTLRYAL